MEKIQRSLLINFLANIFYNASILSRKLCTKNLYCFNSENVLYLSPHLFFRHFMFPGIPTYVCLINSVTIQTNGTNCQVIQ